jgi:predicted Zn-dependent peptidase
VDHDFLVELANDRTGVDGTTASETGPTGRAAPVALPALAGRRFERKDTEQYHVCMGGTGVSRHDDRRFALRVLDTIFGGTSSSRLFQEIRERRGLAYAVYSFTSAYADTGQVGLYVGTRGENLVQALSIVGSELTRLRAEPATAEELSRAKENLKGRVVLALESTGARMNRLGSEILAGSPLMSLDEVVARIDAVSLEDLASLAHELWDPEHLSAAGIGPDQERYEEAMAAVTPTVVQTPVAGAH